MTEKQTAPYNLEEQELAAMARALGHPARIAILKELSRRKVCICGEIVEVLPLAQSTVSQHLKALKEAGLIEGTVDGPKSCYCINQKAVERLAALFSTFLDDTLSPFKCC